MQCLALASFPKANWPLLCNVLCQVGDQTCCACAVISFKCRIRCSGVMVIPVIMSVGVSSLPPPTFSISAWAPFKYVCRNPYCHLGKKGKPWTSWPTNTQPVELALSRCRQQQHLLQWMQWQLLVLGLWLQWHRQVGCGSPIPALQSAACPVPRNWTKEWLKCVLAYKIQSDTFVCWAFFKLERKIEQASFFHNLPPVAQRRLHDGDVFSNLLFHPALFSFPPPFLLSHSSPPHSHTCRLLTAHQFDSWAPFLAHTGV